jgi:hypothetical protein
MQAAFLTKWRAWQAGTRHFTQSAKAPCRLSSHCPHGSSKNQYCKGGIENARGIA